MLNRVRTTFLLSLPLLLLCSFASQVLAALPLADHVTVDKSERLMRVWSAGKVVRQFSIALGGEPKGHKTTEGDQRTPEGQYTLDYIKLDSSFYRSMHISYPNVNDTKQAETRGVSAGGFIMVHGQRNGLAWLSAIS